VNQVTRVNRLNGMSRLSRLSLAFFLDHDARMCTWVRIFCVYDIQEVGQRIGKLWKRKFNDHGHSRDRKIVGRKLLFGSGFGDGCRSSRNHRRTGPLLFEQGKMSHLLHNRVCVSLDGSQNIRLVDTGVLLLFTDLGKNLVLFLDPHQQVHDGGCQNHNHQRHHRKDRILHGTSIETVSFLLSWILSFLCFCFVRVLDRVNSLNTQNNELPQMQSDGLGFAVPRETQLRARPRRRRRPRSENTNNHQTALTRNVSFVVWNAPPAAVSDSGLTARHRDHFGVGTSAQTFFLNRNFPNPEPLPDLDYPWFSELVVAHLPDKKLADLDREDCPTCAICYVPWSESEPVKKLDCAHFFHSQCLVPWFQRNSSCPLCRKKVPGLIQGQD